MPQFQGVLVFNQGKLGWSETWYLNKSSYAAALISLQNYAGKRGKLLGQGAIIEGLRISDVDVKQDSAVAFDGWDNAVSPLIADDPWNAIYVRVDATELYRRQVWLRGLPDDWILLGGGNPAVNPPTPALNSAMAALKASMIANGLQLKVISKAGAGSTGIDISGVLVDANGFLQFLVAGMTGMPNDTFRVSGVQGPSSLNINGVYKIKTNTGAVITTTFKPPAGFDPFAYSAGKARPRVITYVAATNMTVIRTAKRSTGRAFFVPRGRRAKSA